MILLDTNVLIEILKNNKETLKTVNQLQLPLTVSSITAMELLYGARNKQENVQLQRFLLKFKRLPVTASISDTALELVTQYAQSHQLDIPDSLIGSTSLQHHIPLFTYNLKDFRFIPEIQLHPIR